MFREVKSDAGWRAEGFGPFRRHFFVHGRSATAQGHPPGRFRQLLTVQAEEPVTVMNATDRRYWMYRDRFYWEDEQLEPGDVAALVYERERRNRRRLERARQLMHARGEAATPAGRAGIPLDVRRAVWERDGGRCVACGAQFELQFDHVIPVALGGGSSAANLQVLCGRCNRRKGASLG